MDESIILTRNFVKKIIKTMDPCSEENVRFFDPRHINIDFLAQILSKSILSYSEVKALVCIFQIVLQKNNIMKNKLPFTDSRIDEYLKNVKQMPVKSGFGIVFYADVISKDNKIVIKRSQEIADIDSTVREYVIGMKIINPLRSLTPCFVITLGGFACSGEETVSKDVKLCSPSGNGPEIFYIITENIKGKTLFEHIAKNDMTPLRFTGILVNILVSLEIAQRKHCFTHYDLHTGNVMIKQLSYEVSYKLINDTEEYVVRSQKEIPIIIDYGKSFALVDNYLLGDPTYFEGSPIGKYMLPAYDMYRLLISALQISITSKNKGLRDFIFPLFKLFHGDRYKVYDNFMRITKNNKVEADIEQYKQIIARPLRNVCGEVHISSPYITPLDFLGGMREMYPSFVESYLSINKRETIGFPIEDYSTRLYYDLAGRPDVDKVSNVLYLCLKTNPSYLINIYSLRILQRYRKNLDSDGVNAFATDFEQKILANRKEFLKNDKITFSKGFDLDISDLLNPDFDDLVRIFKTKVTFSFWDEEDYDSYAPYIKKVAGQLSALEKYLNIFYTILELELDKMEEYQKFVADMKKILETISQDNLNIVRTVSRWCKSVEQYYEMPNCGFIVESWNQPWSKYVRRMFVKQDV